jgi:hypothetical protein
MTIVEAREQLKSLEEHRKHGDINDKDLYRSCYIILTILTEKRQNKRRG